MANPLAEPLTPPDAWPGGERFFPFGLLTFALDLAVLVFLYGKGCSLALAHGSSFLAAVAAGRFLSVMASGRKWSLPPPGVLLSLCTATLLVLFLRGGIFASLMRVGALQPHLALLLGVSLSSLILHLLGRHGVSSRIANNEAIWNGAGQVLVAIVAYLILLRLVYLGVPELLFEEAYYWNYAKHLDIGYLDHPPMVGWLIWLFTEWLGDNEFAVRFGAFACWAVTAFYSIALTRRIHQGLARTMLLVAVLPSFFAVGFFMTPDAPLTACWAAALFYLYQALIEERRGAWLGAGIAIGLGMLSKYTIALLGPAVLLFVLWDRRSWKWLVRPEPYLAVVLAVLLFLPVLAWNAEHQWISFLYQSRDRMAEKFEFSFHAFLLGIVLILTPAGFLAVVAALVRRKSLIVPDVGEADRAARTFRLLALLTLFPVLLFTALSLYKEIRFYWTVPAWLGLVPYIALVMEANAAPGARGLLPWIRRTWPPVVVFLAIFYGAALHWLGPGIPGVPYPQNSYLLGWEEFGGKVEGLVRRLEAETGEEILVVGMDRNRVASGLAFYRTRAAAGFAEAGTGSPAYRTSSWHLFGEKSLMYEFWFPRDEQKYRTMLLVSKSRGNLTGDNVRARVRRVGEVREIAFRKNGKPAGRYYYVLVEGYRNEKAPAPLVKKPNP